MAYGLWREVHGLSHVAVYDDTAYRLYNTCTTRGLWHSALMQSPYHQSLTVVPKLTWLFAAATDAFDLSDRSADPPSPPSKTARMFWVLGACHNVD